MPADLRNPEHIAMYNGLSIERFRGIREFTLPELCPINLIVGRNNAGKTAILEGVLLLHKMDPHILLRRVQNWMRPGIVNVREMWSWAFWDRQIDPGITIKGHTAKGDRVLRVSVDQTPETQLDLPLVPSSESEEEEESGSIADYFERLVMDLQLPGGAKHRTTTRLALEGNRPRLKFSASRIPDQNSALFKGTSRNLGWHDAHRYSRLVKVGLESSILETARLIDERIKDLSVLIDDDRPTLYADIGFHYPMPVNLLGEGFNSLLSILFAATAVRDGVLLVDEVENGLHYSSLLALWRGLIPISRRFNVQVIATTHSWECIRAAHEAFEMSKEDLLLHRLENVGGIATAETYDYEMISTALAAGLEMR